MSDRIGLGRSLPRFSLHVLNNLSGGLGSPKEDETHIIIDFINVEVPSQEGSFCCAAGEGLVRISSHRV